MMHTPMEIMVRVAVMMAVIGAVVVALCYAGAVLWHWAHPRTMRRVELAPHKVEPPDVFGGDFERGDGHGGSYDITAGFADVAQAAPRSAADGRTPEQLAEAGREMERRRMAALAQDATTRRFLASREE